jgi:head-tail adaptor
MNIGPLNTRCRIEYKSVTQDANYGTDVVTWMLLAVRWCNVQDALPSRSESVRQGLTVALNQTRLRLRYCTDIDSSMRVVINRPDQTIYQIVSGPAILGDKDGVEFMLEKVSSDNG